jgi:hypothetical protein
MPFTYVIFAPGYDANLFLLFFAAPLALAGVSLALWWWLRWRLRQAAASSAASMLASSASAEIIEAIKE